MAFLLFLCFSTHLSAENIKAVNFIHDRNIRQTKVILQQLGNPYFDPIFSTIQTIEMWVKVSETADAQGGVLYTTKSNYVGDPTDPNKAGGFEIKLQPGGWARTTFCVGDGGVDVKWINMQTVKGEWTHYAFVINAQNLKVYKNGVEIVNQDFMGSIAKGTGDLVLGMNPNWDVDEQFQGMVADFRIWTKALTPAEILSNKDVYFTIKKVDLFLNWTMQEGTGLVLNNLMHSTRNKGTIVDINDIGDKGVEWADNSGCPIHAEGTTALIDIQNTNLNAKITNNGNSLLINTDSFINIKIYSINGSLCLNENITGNQVVDISMLPKGFYTIQVGNNTCEKFIK